MNGVGQDGRERLLDLLAARVTVGLEPAEERELDELLLRHPDLGPDHFELAAAAIDLALLDDGANAEAGPVPDSLTRRVQGQAERHYAERSDADLQGADLQGADRQGADRYDADRYGADRGGELVPLAAGRPAERARSDRSSGAGSSLLRNGWWVAAASLVLALFGWWPRLFDPAEVGTVDDPAVVAETPADGTQSDGTQSDGSQQDEPASDGSFRPGLEYDTLVAQQDALELSWDATEDPGATGAGGEVVWSTERQQGFMRFTGLPANDPELNQYQLWIFDAEQDERYPIDGGVFDIPAGGAGEVVVKIDPKIEVTSPTLFAITLEKPGGVVVSSRERLLLLASVS